MVKKFLFSILFASVSLMSYSQKQESLGAVLQKNLDNAWFGNGTVDKILKNQRACENLVRRLKSSRRLNPILKSKYTRAKNAYDVVLDAMTNDVNKAKTVGDIYEMLATSKDRRSKYGELGNRANALCIDFKKAAEQALQDGMGLS